MKFSSGKYAHGFCERCGFRYDYNSFKKEWNGLSVCPECWEAKHPQLDPPRVKADAEALRDPLPEGAGDDALIADGDAAAFLALVNARD